MYLSHLIFDKNKIDFFMYIDTQQAKIWKYKKSCEKTICKLNSYQKAQHPSKFNIIEITDQQTLRKLKLKKLNK